MPDFWTLCILPVAIFIIFLTFLLRERRKQDKIRITFLNVEGPYDKEKYRQAMHTSKMDFLIVATSVSGLVVLNTIGLVWFINTGIYYFSELP